MISRRRVFQLAGTLAAIGPATAASQNSPAASGRRWPTTFEGQRKADLGNGYYLNPIFAGDFPDPSILKDGSDYYITFSSFTLTPGLMIWHSRDLVNWEPVGPALSQPTGSVLAPDLCKHNGRFYIYFPMNGSVPGRGTAVVYADNIKGPWSEPILMAAGGIDPGHAVGEDGQRYLFTGNGQRVRLKPGGLETDGTPEKVYDGWKYPEEWIDEAFSLESPKIMRRGDYFYLISAEGGTIGPPTSHMVVIARSRSINGPWENSPYNPLVRTKSESEYWWTKGHGTLVEGPAGDWWVVYHAYENSFRTLGRHTLLEPIVWTADGWPRSKVVDVSKPILKPKGGQAVTPGVAHSDNFSAPAFGTRWRFASMEPTQMGRAQFENNSLILAGHGTGPTDSAPLTALEGDLSYEASVVMEVTGDARGGLLLYYNDRALLGLGTDGKTVSRYTGMPGFGGAGRGGAGNAGRGRAGVSVTGPLHVRIVNDRHVVTLYHSTDGSNWIRNGARGDLRGYDAATFGGLMSLRPALLSAGTGSVRFRDYRYRALA